MGFYQADISKAEEFSKIFERVNSFTKVLDALVNNAAVQVSKPLIETSVEEWIR